ncbi:MAG: hypothetical protein OIF51_15080 [Cellvibrionaceae bacterium]|nr:hypothetical protein [Cellvibrionaceae bacterium]
MRFKFLTFTALTALTLSSVLQAADLPLERDILARLQQLSENNALLVQDRESSLQDFERKLNAAREDLANLRLELQDKEQELAQVTAAGESQARQRKLAEHALAMAKRGVKNRQKRVERIEGKLSQEKILLEQARSRLSKNGADIARQELKIARLKEAQKKQQLAKAAEAKRQQERAAKPQVQQTLAQTKPKLVLAEPKIEAKVPKSVPEQELPATAVKQSSDPAQDQDQQQKQQLAMLDDLARKQAAAEEQRLQTALAGPERSGRQLYKGLQIKSDTVDGRFEYLGNHQYRSETVVTAGRHMFTVGSHHYRGTIPNADDGQIYVFLYDTSRKGKPRLSMYRKSLLP